MEVLRNSQFGPARGMQPLGPSTLIFIKELNLTISSLHVSTCEKYTNKSPNLSVSLDFLLALFFSVRMCKLLVEESCTICFHLYQWSGFWCPCSNRQIFFLCLRDRVFFLYFWVRGTLLRSLKWGTLNLQVTTVFRNLSATTILTIFIWQVMCWIRRLQIYFCTS